MEQGRCTAIVLAAGQGKRMHSKIQKQFLEIGGKPVLYYSLHCFQESPLIQDIILVMGEEMISYCEQEIVKKYGFSKVRKVTAGGKERYYSVYAGLLCCQDTDYVYIHDGARPFITEEMVLRGYEAVKRTNACVMGMPSKDTVKLADSSGYIKETPDRKIVWNIQTPQIFSYPEIYSAYQKAKQEGMQGITDDAMVMEQYGSLKVKLEEGAYDNIKITTPEDILLAEQILETLEEE